MDEKKALRIEIRQLKRACPLEERRRKSLSVWEAVERDEVFQQAETVLAYWSMDDEVYTHDFVKRWAGHKTLLLPCVKGDELELRYFDGEERLSLSRYVAAWLEANGTTPENATIEVSSLEKDQQGVSVRLIVKETGAHLLCTYDPFTNAWAVATD